MDLSFGPHRRLFHTCFSRLWRMNPQFNLSWFKCFQKFYRLHHIQLCKKPVNETEIIRKVIRKACIWSMKHSTGETGNKIKSFSEYELLLCMFFYGVAYDFKEFSQHICEIIICCDETIWNTAVKNFKDSITMTDNEFYLLVQRMSIHTGLSITALPEEIVQYIKDFTLSSDLLVKSCSEGNCELVKFIIKLGVVVNSPALHAAIDQGHHTVVDLLLENGAKHYWANAEGYPALYVAAESGQTIIVKSLLRKSLCTELKYRNGMNLLHIATMSGQFDLVKFLMENNFKISSITDKKETPLHLACKINNDSSSKFKKYSQIDENKQHSIVKIILDTDKAIVNEKSIIGETALHLACSSNYKQIAETLLSHGADVNAKNSCGNTPGHVAAVKGHATICELLLRFGADFEAVNEKLNLPLHLAVTLEQTEVVEFLLSVMNDINQREGQGFTALHLAARNGNDRILTLLMKRGANPEIVAYDGRKAVDLVKRDGKSKAIEIFTPQGAAKTTLLPLTLAMIRNY